MRLVKPVMKKPLRQQNRQIISYVPRTEPAPPEHAIKMDSFRDVWMLRGKYVAFVLMGESFNEAFMMHTTTSPSYPIVASVETAAAMLRGNPGKRLINRSVERALHFRKEVQRLREESDGWFFDIWQPPQVDEAECWPVAPGVVHRRITFLDP